MIQTQTILKIIDNSGAKTVRCIKVLGGFQKRYCYAGDVIVVSVQKIRKKNKLLSKVQKGDVCHAIVTRTRSKKKRKDGLAISFKDNSGVLVNSQNKPLFTRIKGAVSRDLKKNNFMKLVSLSSGFL